MIAVTKEVPFTPSWHEGTENAPVYLLRVGTVAERAALEAELAGDYRCGSVYNFDLVAAFIEGVNHLLADNPGREELVTLAEGERSGETLAPADKARLITAREIVAEHWPPYAVLAARHERRSAIAPLVTFRRFCIGWQNVEGAFEKGLDGLVTLAAMADLPDLDIRAAGSHAYALLYAGSQAGNLPAPSKSDDGRKTSISGARSPAVGKSVASATRKTRASRSRRGRGAS